MKEIAISLPSNDYNNPLNNSDKTKSKNSKKSHTVDYGKKDIPITSHKKKQDTVTPVVEHQTIDDILNSFDNSTETNHDDENVDYNNEIEVTESSQSHIRSRAIISDDFNNETLISAPLRNSVSRTINILSDDLVSSHEIAS
ncbi:hypothetical protein F8M41_017576 [Gigaspora margarita]|uniref:Uncharacterized protein n=1 Tax=Gigaspora margarita TaxID=4874 RepID=A0A8H4EM05_GIGMA|nr:hypothetical protein F8M41_017576 [Gigaspora margarita]